MDVAALLGIPVQREYEPMNEDEHAAVRACYEELRTSHPGKHFTVMLYGTNEQQQIRFEFTAMSPGILDEILATVRRHGLHASLGADEAVRGGGIVGSSLLFIGPLAREKNAAAADELAETPLEQVH